MPRAQYRKQRVTGAARLRIGGVPPKTVPLRGATSVAPCAGRLLKKDTTGESLIARHAVILVMRCASYQLLRQDKQGHDFVVWKRE